MDLSAYLPSPSQTSNLAIAMLTMIGFAAVGGALSGTKRDPLFDVFTGFGAVTGVMTVLGVATDIPFSWMAIGFWSSAALAAIFVLYKSDFGMKLKSLLKLRVRIVILCLPILVSVSAMNASQWDEFSQWLFNALYIYKFDLFPHNDLPKSPSVFPAYPHGNQLFTYLVSYASGDFVEMSVAYGNVLLLMALAPVYVAMVETGRGISTRQMDGWFAAGLGILGVTILSTTFVQKLVFTAYADTATAVLFAVIGILFWHLLNELADNARNSSTICWQFAFACMLFINLKQTNLVLLGILVLAGGGVVLRDPKICLRKFLLCLPTMLGLPLIVYFSWRFHVAEHLIGKEFYFLPSDKWSVDRAFDILSRMFLVASKKGAYFGMMTAISIAGIWCFVTGRGGRYGRLLFMSGAVFMCYWLFLWAMYITAFTEFEATRATSFWRYNIHLGLLGALTAAVTLGMLFRNHLESLLQGRKHLKTAFSGLIVLGVAATPIIFNHKVRIDRRPQIEHIRVAGQDLAQTLPSNTTLAVFDPDGQGLAALIIKYEVLGFSAFDPSPQFVYDVNLGKSNWRKTASLLKKYGVSHVWIHQATDWYAAGLGIPQLRSDGSTLVKKSENGSWQIEEFWPYKNYTAPYSLPD